MPSVARRLVLLGSLALVACKPWAKAGWSREELAELAVAPDLELLTIDPRGAMTVGDGERLSGYLVLGKTSLGAADGNRLLLSFDRALRNPSTPAACFEPRHALRGTGPDGEVIALVCFACAGVVFHSGDGEHGGGLDAAGSAVFEELRVAAGLPIAP